MYFFFIAPLILFTYFVALQVKWLKGDKVIKPSKYFQMSREGDTNILRISEVFPEDEGEYKCVVSNPGGQVEVRAPLKVLGKLLENLAI